MHFELAKIIFIVYTVLVMNHQNLMQDGLEIEQVESLIDKLYDKAEYFSEDVTRKVVKDNHTYQREWEQLSIVIGSAFEVVLGREWERGKLDDTSVYMLIKRVSDDRLILRKRYWKHDKLDSHVMDYWKKVHDTFKYWNGILRECLKMEFNNVLESL